MELARSAIEAVEDEGQLGRRDADTVVAHTGLNASVGRTQRDGDPPTARGVLQGIADQVVQHTLDQAQVGVHQWQPRIGFEVQRDPLAVRHQLELLQHVGGEFGERERLVDRAQAAPAGEHKGGLGGARGHGHRAFSRDRFVMQTVPCRDNFSGSDA